MQMTSWAPLPPLASNGEKRFRKSGSFVGKLSMDRIVFQLLLAVWAEIDKPVERFLEEKTCIGGLSSGVEMQENMAFH
jgi:hypothetical protein